MLETKYDISIDLSKKKQSLIGKTSYFKDKLPTANKYPQSIQRYIEYL